MFGFVENVRTFATVEPRYRNRIRYSVAIAWWRSQVMFHGHSSDYE